MGLLRSPAGVRSLSISYKNVWYQSNIRELCEAMASESSSITSLTLPDIEFRSERVRSGLRLFKSLLKSLLKNEKITKLNELNFIQPKSKNSNNMLGRQKYAIMRSVQPYLQRNKDSPHRTTLKNFSTSSDRSIINLMILYKDNINSTFQILQAKPELLSRAVTNQKEDNGGDNDDQPNNTKRRRTS